MDREEGPPGLLSAYSLKACISDGRESISSYRTGNFYFWKGAVRYIKILEQHMLPPR